MSEASPGFQVLKCQGCCISPFIISKVGWMFVDVCDRNLQLPEVSKFSTGTLETLKLEPEKASCLGQVEFICKNCGISMAFSV